MIGSLNSLRFEFIGLVEMINDPAQTEKALLFMARKGIDLAALFGAFSAEFAQTEIH